MANGYSRDSNPWEKGEPAQQLFPASTLHRALHHAFKTGAVQVESDEQGECASKVQHIHEIQVLPQDTPGNFDTAESIPATFIKV